ncbi:MAG: signal recognition particle protein [bacterium]|uniref:Signal recognition particle protein n=2 Tax=Bacteria candidate phyla TaxID=1783234 RepID=A0A101I2I8_UNCT6|nr:MAG: Signal recognition particle protein [candidate division TA06 bacterium 32_111]KUK87831.1 MAG: Signal recognition particle protein [candidate division TA06 bacterium 34_109]MDI6700638.1 signal recognition particle protein [bacterium]HAF07984.1 signal recognition particle protein [candidate division WOR-3 bacterium]HCP16314.1 signal recognition particle protein [candidate division WOR-3 bacterium]
MLERITERFSNIFSKIKNKGKVTEDDLKVTLREIKLLLLEADVNYRIVNDFVNSLKEDIVGKEVYRSLKPEHIIIKSVNDKLVELFSAGDRELHFKGNPAIISLVGLQGSGKTTTCGKLAKLFQKYGRRTLLVPCDIKRPAAYDQLKQLSEKNSLNFFKTSQNDLIKRIEDAVGFALRENFDTLILDTAGRLHIDEELMDELKRIETEFKPCEKIFVGDSLTGQDAVNSAKTFNEMINITGVILTKMDGDQKGGAALSIVKSVEKPIKFICKGEHIDDIEKFYPDRFVSRLLGMGDIVTLVEKTENLMKEEETLKLEKKLKDGKFDFEDYLVQIKQLRKMGPLTEIIKMIPGVGGKVKLSGMEEENVKKVEAMINSMTKEERKNPELLNNKSRVKRIAKGSGTSVAMVKQLLVQHKNMKKMLKNFKDYF